MTLARSRTLPSLPWLSLRSREYSIATRGNTSTRYQSKMPEEQTVMLRHYLLAVLLAAMLLPCASASAATIYLKARLAPQLGVASDADGAALFTFDTASRSLSWTVTYQDLSSALTDAHLHGPALPGQDAPIVVAMPVTASPLSGGTTITALQQEDLLAGLWYVNLHTATYSDGEISGQLEVIYTNHYTATYSYKGESHPYGNPFISGHFALDPSTLQLAWTIESGHYSFFPSGWGTASIYGTGGGQSTPFVITNAGTGSENLTPAQAAHLVNGFWYVQLGDGNPTYRADIVPGYPHLANVSTRVHVGSGDSLAIAGFVVSGPKEKPVAIKVSGKSLANYGVTAPLADPKVTLVRMSDNTV